MANIDSAFGLIPVAHVGQTDNNGGQTQYSIGDTQTTAIFTGDPVKYKSDGTVEVATAGDPVVGVFGGCFYTDPTTSKPTWSPYFPASLAPGDAKAFIWDNPMQTFIVQQDSVVSNLLAANLNENANLIFNAGNTTTGVSGVEIDSSSADVTAALQVRLIDFYATPSNNTTANNSVFVVKINNHKLMGGTGTLGV
jgi:hypothetical protein|tara:strand:- start:433 stop:1017 length:585 start_codon:yes stop_codon:yes gene_type:complete